MVKESKEIVHQITEQEGTEPIFITYVNTDIKQNPEVLHNIYEGFKNMGIRPYEHEGDKIKDIINYFVYFVELGSKAEAEKHLNDILFGDESSRKQDEHVLDRLIVPYDLAKIIKIAYIAAYRKLSRPDIYTDVFLLAPFIGALHNSIYEAQQEFKVFIENIIENSYKCDHCYSKFSDIISGFSVELSIEPDLTGGIKTTIYFPGINRDEGLRHPADEQSLGDLFSWYICGISLIMFLSGDDREKLKKCPQCGNLFIGKRKTKQFCSDQCRWDHHNRRNR